MQDALVQLCYSHRTLSEQFLNAATIKLQVQAIVRLSWSLVLDPVVHCGNMTARIELIFRMRLTLNRSCGLLAGGQDPLKSGDVGPP